jgi:NADPH:quinone reductase-like Zn-dependent oxidoreductase
MHALVLAAMNEPMSYVERPDLTVGPGEVLVAIKAAALNRRDFWITQGMYPGVKMPVVLGSDGAGIVIEVGEGVESEWRGQDVVINPGLAWGENRSVQSSDFRILGMPDDGTFATQVVVPADVVHKKPEHLSWQQAAALPLGGVTAYRALFTQGQLTGGDRVLVTGVGGGVATITVQMAVAAGATVYVTSSSDEKLKRARELGAAAGFNYTRKEWSVELKAEAGGVDLIVDSAGGEGYEAVVNLSAPGGRIVSYGATTGLPKKLDLFKIFWKQIRLIGTTMGSPEDFEEMIEFVAMHKIAPTIDRVVALSDGGTAVERMRESPQFGKIVLDCQE